MLGKLKWIAVGVGISLIAFFLVNNKEEIIKMANFSSNDLSTIKINPEFGEYISAFTAGYISGTSSVKIKFTIPLKEAVQLNEEEKEEYFSFSPAIKGKTYWRDDQTIEFVPDERLEQNKVYKATFRLGKILDVKKELKNFEFGFKTVQQSLKVELGELTSYTQEDCSYYKFSGTLTTADYMESVEVEKVVRAITGSKKVKLRWWHDEKNVTHKFYADSIQRGLLNSSTMKIEWDAKVVNCNEAGDMAIEIPRQKAFELLNVKAVNNGEQYVLAVFSNPLNNNQSLEGLINIEQSKSVRYVVDNNHLKIYPGETITGNTKIKLLSAVADNWGNKLGKTAEYVLHFEELKPAVDFVGSGVILPSTNGMTIPFEAVNLKAVDVKIIKIYENNVLQFLQYNNLNGNDELARVGKKVYEGTVNLGITNAADFGKKKRFSFDISNVIKSEPGAIYRVIFGFKKQYSTYPCSNSSNDYNAEMEKIIPLREESEYGYYYNDYEWNYNYYDEEFNWSQRDNPCNAAYYSSYKISVSKNILASDLGVIVKRAEDGSCFVAASDLISTKPLSGVKIQFYDYQQQLIAEDKTNSNGFLFIYPSSQPYFVVATNGNNKAYVKVDAGNTLSTNMFEVSGSAMQKGLKGFLYGERGVWRPGDTLFYTFILEDKSKKVPFNHPVVMELYSPTGQLYQRKVAITGVDGFYKFVLKTNADAPTGNWQVKVKIGQAEFSGSARIETIMPNRLKINFSVGDNLLIASASKTNAKLHSNWLTGATAKNLKAIVAAKFNKITTEFKRYKNYSFDDQTLQFDAEEMIVYEGALDNEGNTSFPLNFNLKGKSPGMLKANFVTKVFEQSGQFSVDRFSMLYSPYECYAGLAVPSGEKNSGILFTEKDHVFKIVTLNQNGIPVSRSRIKLELFKINWRWWWEQYEDDFASYYFDQYHEPVLIKETSTVNGEGSVVLNVDENDWGRYLVRVVDLDGGHSASQVVYFDWANWMSRKGNDGKIISNILSFTSDKQEYKKGEDATISIPSPEGGRALITIETGTKVLKADWIETEKGVTKYKFNITADMAPNVYVHVSLIQPHAQTKNDLPVRLYGVVPVSIDDPNTHLRPLLSCASVFAPETKVPITVSEENGKAMTYTLAIVDEGLLDLTHFKTPDPWPHFYAKEALGVKTWDIYDQVIGAYGGELERILKIGGDGTEINKDAAKANRFKPMVRYIGPFHINKNEKKTHTVDIPMYVGSVRVMLIAGFEGAYGSSEKTVPVKSDMMILGTLPRVLSTNEKVKLPVTLISGDKVLNNVVVSVKTNGLVKVDGESSKNSNAGKNDEKILDFELKAGSESGIATIDILAVSGSFKTKYRIELDVRNPNPFQTEVKDFTLDPGKSITIDYAALGEKGTNSGVVEISSIPSININERLQYLIAYPHGCIEQTTSAVFAQLYLNEVLNLSEKEKSKIDYHIKTAIDALLKFALPDGSMSYWPGEGYYSPWGTLYAGHFLILAKEKGYKVPDNLLSKWTVFQKNAANKWKNSSEPLMYTRSDYDFVQAYRLYLLALIKQPSLSAMNVLKETSGLKGVSRWLLASAYALTGYEDVAENLITNQTTDIVPYNVNYLTYGSSFRDEAMILEALCNMGKKSHAFTALKKVAQNLSSDKYLSTQSTSYSLFAVAVFIKKFGQSSSMQIDCSVNNMKKEWPGKSSIAQFDIDYNKKMSGKVAIKNNGKGVVFVRLVNKGKPMVGEEKEASENILMDIVYKNSSGTVIQPEEMEQGKDFIMEIVLKNPGLKGAYKNLALTATVPSGWEIHNSRMDNNEQNGAAALYTYMDIRDDKVMYYFDLKENEIKKFQIHLNATYLGRFYLPASVVEAMYENDIYARSKGRWVNVLKRTTSVVSN